jgi:L-lactate dehydrogenase complex protein LldG
MTGGRAEMLRAIRENLAASAPHDRLVRAPRHGSASLPVLTRSPRAAAVENPVHGVQRFQQQLEAVGGRCIIVRGAAEAAQALSRILAACGGRRVVASDAPLAQRLLHAAAGDVVRSGIDRLARDELFACDAGVTTAQWGIAETGTLVLESAWEHNRLCSLVPRVHIAVLPAENILDTLGEALEHVCAADGSGNLASRAITFITGPSRTSDIELTLVIGVHGPQELYVIVISDDSPGDVP